MCRIEERVYVGVEGQRSMFEERFPCDKSRHGKLCSKVKKKTSEYHTKSGSFSRDNTPSPINPPTPTSTGSYLVQQRRPSGSGGRPSTREGQKTIAPEIIINFNSTKNRGRRYSGGTGSTKTNKRSPLMASPIGLTDLIDDFPGSDASHTIRTGFPDAPLPTPTMLGHSDHYIPSVSHGYHHRRKSSMSSINAPSQPPSLCVTSDLDYESPDSRRSARYPPTIVHSQNSSMQPPSPSRASALKVSSTYRTSVVAPRVTTHDAHLHEGLYSIDHGDLADRSAPSYASSGVPDTTRKSKDRDDRRKRKEDDDRRQADRDALSRHIAEELARDNAKQVRFELDRPVARERERAEKAYAEKDNDRIQARDDARRLERQERERQDREEAEAKQRKKDKPKSSPAKQEAKPALRAQKPSMTQDQLAEQRRLLAAEEHRMQSERQVAEARDRDEQHNLVRHKQDAREYFDPRDGDRSLGRRASISQHPTLPSPPMPPFSGLTRSNTHRRPSIHQHNSPLLTSARQTTGPPISFPTHFPPQSSNRITPSPRRPSISHHDAPPPPPPQPSTRKRRDSASASASTSFSTPVDTITPATMLLPDPWDARTAAVHATRIGTDNRLGTSMQQRGHAVLHRSGGTRVLYQDVGVFDDDDDDEGEDEDYEDGGYEGGGGGSRGAYGSRRVVRKR